MPSCALAEPLRVGAEFQVNAYTSGTQRWPAVAMDEEGAFVIAWHGAGGDGSGVFARRFTAAGDPQGSELRVSSYGIPGSYPAIAMDDEGEFVVAWRSWNDGVQDGVVHARLFSSSGIALGPHLVVSSYTVPWEEWGFPDVAMDDDGDFVVAWTSFGVDGAATGVSARRFGSAGDALETEFLVNTYTPGYALRADVAMDADGDFVVVWGNLRDGAHREFAQRFASSGARVGSEFQVNVATTHAVYASTAMSPTGEFVVVWHTFPPPAARAILARRFDAAGEPIGDDLELSTYFSAFQGRTAVAMSSDGEFVVTWSADLDGAPSGVFARRFASGAPQGKPFQVNTHSLDDQNWPAIAINDAGDLVVAWESRDQEGEENRLGVFAQRFTVLELFDVDGDGMTLPLTDGLLFLRWLFGFAGSTLTSGALGEGCSRCDAAAVSAHLQDAGSLLDVDGDGGVEPLTDGLLALRYGFAMRGEPLVTGAVAADCTRCTAEAIESFLAASF